MKRLLSSLVLYIKLARGWGRILIKESAMCDSGLAEMDTLSGHLLVQELC